MGAIKTKSIDMNMLKALAESKGYSLVKLAEMYGRNDTYFNDYQMRRRGYSIRKPEYMFILDVLEGREYEKPMMVDKKTICHHVKKAGLSITDLCSAIDRSTSYISNKEDFFLLYAGEVKIVKDLLGVSVEDLAKPYDLIQEEEPEQDCNPYVTDLESLADTMKEEQTKDLTEFTNEELLAELARRLEVRQWKKRTHSKHCIL